MSGIPYLIGPTNGADLNAQGKLPQIVCSISALVLPRQVIADIGDANSDKINVHKYEGPSTLGIRENDLIFMRRPVNEVSMLFPLTDLPDTSAISECQSAFASFAGRPILEAAHSRVAYKFLGVAKSAIDFDSATDLKQLSVACGGIINWTNYTTKVVEAGALMTWDVYSQETLSKAPPTKRSFNVQYPGTKAIFVPVEAKDMDQAADVAAVLKEAKAITSTDVNDQIMNAFKIGERYAVGRCSYIVGTNCGGPVPPGRVGQMKLGHWF